MGYRPSRDHREQYSTGPIDIDMNPGDGRFAETLNGFLAIKRFGHGSEIASLVSYLASPDAAFITGANIKIDGGFDAEAAFIS